MHTQKYLTISLSLKEVSYSSCLPVLVVQDQHGMDGDGENEHVNEHVHAVVFPHSEVDQPHPYRMCHWMVD